jgi:hypothetical protein
MRLSSNQIFLEWRKISSALIKWLEDKEAQRAETAREQQYQNWFGLLQQLVSEYCRTAPEKGMPHMVDIGHFPEVRAAFDVTDAEHTLDSLRATFSPLLPKMVTQWREDAEHKFIKFLRSELRPPKGVNPLDLASATVQCTICHQTRTGLSSIFHGCTNMP